MKLEAMKEFAKDNDIKVSKKETEKSLVKKIREKWTEEKIEMECLCPQCDEEIPDIDTCPFCGATFEGDEEQKEKEEKKEEVEKKSKKEKASKKDKAKSKTKDKDKDKGKDKKEEVEKTEEVEKKSKKEEEKKDTVEVIEETEKTKKEIEKTEEPEKKMKRGPKTGGLNFKDAVDVIAEHVEEAGYDVRARGSFTSYFFKGTRIFAIAKTTRTYSLQVSLPGFEIKGNGEYCEFTDEERESGHLASTYGIFKTTNLEDVLVAAKGLTELAKRYNRENPGRIKSNNKSSEKKVENKPEKKAVKISTANNADAASALVEQWVDAVRSVVKLSVQLYLFIKKV